MKSTIQPVRIREAKDFLVAQTAEQAALEGVPLSDVEKRMMYFTESGYVPEDPIKLNDAFEAEYDREGYETKISQLLHHAYRRLKKENDVTRKNWDLAIKCLRRGDHYLLVMWDGDTSVGSSGGTSGATPLRHSLPLFGASLGVIALGFLVYFIAAKFEPQRRWLQKNIPQPNPHVLLGVFLALVVASLFFQRPLGIALDWLLDRRFFRFFLGPKEDEKDSD
jgi:hypothetical protein